MGTARSNARTPLRECIHLLPLVILRSRTDVSAKGKKRLSSLFSSSSLSSAASDREPSTTPSTSSRPQSHLNVSTTSSSGEETPTNVGTAEARSRYPGLSVADGSVEHSTVNGLEGLNLGTVVPITDSPTSSPQASSPLAQIPGPSATARTVPGRLNRARSESLYSQWTEDEDTSDEELSFRTPSEGLSEVEELDEELAEASAAPVAPEDAPVPVVQPQPHLVEKGAEADLRDIVGTGPSTIHRTNPGKKTEVVRSNHPTRESAFSIDQAKSLAPDLETTREGLTLFLTSRMKDAEAMVVARNPEANHMYLLHADGILQALKVSFTLSVLRIS